MDLFGPEPIRIALQAAHIEFDWEGKRHVFDAKDPWWLGEGALI